AGDLKLAALVRDLPEEACVLNRQGGLRGERREELDGFPVKLAGCLPVDDQRTDDLLLAQQRHGEHRAVAEAQEDVADLALVGGVLSDVGELDRRSPLDRLSEGTLALAEA